MALAMAFDEAKTHRLRLEGDPSRGNKGGITQTYFFGSRKGPDSDAPQAKLSKYDPGRVDGAHFHIVDQFQVVLEGTGKLGRHHLTPYCVHFSRAHTPYGPLLSDSDTGFSFFVLRTRQDPGSQRLPQARDKLKDIALRQPWQITRPATFPMRLPDAEAIMLVTIEGMQDEDGLAAYALSMKPNTKTCGPDPSNGQGQYLVAVTGSFWHDDKEHKAPALAFVRPDEDAFQICAGTGGLEALVLNFPRGHRTPAMAVAKSVQVASGFKTWQCALCSFVYDEAKGLPEEGIPPGTVWRDVPQTWTCPDCSSPKCDFEMTEIQSPHADAAHE